MQIVGFEQGDCRNEQLAEQLRKVYALRKKRIAWPRRKGPVGIRVEVKTGHVVGFIN